MSSKGKVTGTPHVPDACRLTLRLTPHGRLVLSPADDAPEMDGALASAGPAMEGGEYLTADVLRALWGELQAAFSSELGNSGAAVQDFLAWLKQMVDAGDIFHPLRWSPQEAFRFLGDVSELERAGIVVRMPATWKAGRPPRPQVTATVGGRAPSGLGKDALLDFRMEITLDGERLTSAVTTG